jgi:tagaturonate epimerase
LFDVSQTRPFEQTFRPGPSQKTKERNLKLPKRAAQSRFLGLGAEISSDSAEDRHFISGLRPYYILYRTASNFYMGKRLELGRLSLGVGDRFGHQSKAQLRACMMAAERGIDIVPVWNKSNREHVTIGSEPSSTRAAADAAVKELKWHKPYHVDADHIRLDTVDRFIPHSDFYTIDVADRIGKPADPGRVKAFVKRHPELVGRIIIPRIERPFQTTAAEVQNLAGKYLLAMQEAGEVYRHIVAAKGGGNFITEVSIDETDSPQTPPELLIILAAIADEGIPVATVAPKFTGRFNKGVDYVGDIVQFEREFNDDLAVMAFAMHEYDLPATVKLSVHSGSDKFSIYEPMRRALARFNAGVHIKTAGTTWLEELIGLAEAGGSGLALAKEIYAGALDHAEELCAPYAMVIDINRQSLPSATAVSGWTSEQYVSALRHDPENAAFNPHLRQLLHVGYKIAARLGDRYLDALNEHEALVAKNVTHNLYARHIKPLFLAGREHEAHQTARPAQSARVRA